MIGLHSLTFQQELIQWDRAWSLRTQKGHVNAKCSKVSGQALNTKGVETSIRGSIVGLDLAVKAES